MRFSPSTHLLTQLSVPILVELIDLVNSVIIFLSQTTLLGWLTFLLRSQASDSHSPALLDLFISSDASICSTKAFPPLGNSDHVVVLVSTDFPSTLLNSVGGVGSVGSWVAWVAWVRGFVGGMGQILVWLRGYRGSINFLVACVAWVHKMSVWVTWVAWVGILAWVAWVHKILAWVAWVEILAWWRGSKEDIQQSRNP